MTRMVHETIFRHKSDEKLFVKLSAFSRRPNFLAKKNINFWAPLTMHFYWWSTLSNLFQVVTGKVFRNTEELFGTPYVIILIRTS